MSTKRTLGCAALAGALALAFPAAAVTPRSDTEIRDNIRTVLRTSAAMGQQDVRVEVRDGAVTLTGTVRTLAQVWDARDLVAKARGVLAIDNRLAIDAGGRSDDAIAYDVRRAFEDKPELNDGGIRAEIGGGKAVLTGRVRDARVRFLAARTAAGIPGVLAVEDRIESPSQPDDVILQGVRSLLAGSTLRPISGRFEVAVEDGVVTLTGVVYRLFSRYLAERVALGVNGVRSVVNDLEVVAYKSDEDVAPERQDDAPR